MPLDGICLTFPLCVYVLLADLHVQRVHVVWGGGDATGGDERGHVEVVLRETTRGQVTSTDHTHRTPCCTVTPQ